MRKKLSVELQKIKENKLHLSALFGVHRRLRGLGWLHIQVLGNLLYEH